MSITVEEFLKLKKACCPKSPSLRVPLTEEIINQAAGCLRGNVVSRLEAAKNLPRKEWPTLVFPRKDGLGNLTPNGVTQAVLHAYWRLESRVAEIAREKEPAPAKMMADGTVHCPWCGRLLVLQKEQK